MMIVDDSHFEYLKLQKGALHALIGDRAAWLASYEQSLAEDMASLAPYLPAACRNVLDVGSGLGGIDVLLDRHYGGLQVRLLDGVDDPAVMTFHNRTYNDMVIAGDFQHRNGVEKFGYYSTPPKGPVDFDLIISLGSWCFHYGPSAYLAFVQKCCHGPVDDANAAGGKRAGTVLILDVRADKPLWRQELREAFREVGVARAARKFNRLVFHVHG